MARVLVGYGTKMGGTAEVAEKIAGILGDKGHEVDLAEAKSADAGGPYDAFVIGSAVYNRQWRGAAVALVKKVGKMDSRPPLWLFQSGPLGDDAGRPQPYPTWLSRWENDLDLRDKVTFGGVIDENAKGFIAKSMLRNGRGGDFRDWDAITAWAEGIAAAL